MSTFFISVIVLLLSALSACLVFSIRRGTKLKKSSDNMIERSYKSVPMITCMVPYRFMKLEPKDMRLVQYANIKAKLIDLLGPAYKEERFIHWRRNGFDIRLDPNLDGGADEGTVVWFYFPQIDGDGPGVGWRVATNKGSKHGLVLKLVGAVCDPILLPTFIGKKYLDPVLQRYFRSGNDPFEESQIYSKAA